MFAIAVMPGNEGRYGQMRRYYYVYIVTNAPGGVLYTGVTGDLQRRIHEHRERVHRGFAWKYNTTRLVYFEATSDVRSAIAREKAIKG